MLSRVAGSSRDVQEFLSVLLGAQITSWPLKLSTSQDGTKKDLTAAEGAKWIKRLASVYVQFVLSIVQSLPLKDCRFQRF